MTLRLVETAPPATEPLTLDEMKLHLRVTSTVEDALITALIGAARELCESYTGLALMARDYSLYLDCWEARELNLPRPPLAGVTAINIYDAANVATALPPAAYIVSTAGHPGRIVLKEGLAPPLPGREADGIEIRFTAGYGDAAGDVPPPLRQGMKQLATYMYERRGDPAEAALRNSGAEILFQPFRVMSAA